MTNLGEKLTDEEVSLPVFKTFKHTKSAIGVSMVLSQFALDRK